MRDATPSSGRIDGPLHHYDCRVYYEDTDAGGIVYHASYLRFAERARTEFMRHMGCDHQSLLREAGVGFAVHELHVRFRQTARLDDALTITSKILESAGASLRVEQTISRGTSQIAILDVRLVCLDRQSRPIRLPLSLRDGMTRLARRAALVATKTDEAAQGGRSTARV